MAKKFMASNTAQYPLVASADIRFDDTFVAEDKTTGDFGVTNGATNKVIKLFTLPENAFIIETKLAINEVFTSKPTVFQIGNKTNPSLHFGALGAAVGMSSGFGTGYGKVSGGGDVLLTLTVPGGNTAGSFTFIVNYIVLGRANENSI